jgi:hypothetical protein
MKVRLLPDFTYEIADIQIGGPVAMEGTLAVHRNYYPHRKYCSHRHYYLSTITGTTTHALLLRCMNTYVCTTCMYIQMSIHISIHMSIHVVHTYRVYIYNVYEIQYDMTQYVFAYRCGTASGCSTASTGIKEI